MTAAVDARAVRRSFDAGGPRRIVLDDVTWRVEAGSFVALTGPSGCGKTTLLRLIAGMDRQFEGALMVDGVDVRALDDRAAARFRAARCGLAFQAPHLLPHLSLRENVALPLVFAGRGANAETEAERLLDAVGLADRASDRAGDLSGGQAQRVGVARALVGDPAVVLCDEPTSALDAATAAGVVDLLLRTRERTGASVIVVSHDPRVVERADARFVMRDGTVVACD